MSETIVRVAAKGDGVTASGRHVPGAAPGDVVREDGGVAPGPHRATPLCRHFALRQAQGCGGCELQHLDEAALAGFVSDRAANAAASHGLAPARLAPPHLSPPRSRRRATLHAARAGGRVALGFRARGSHRVVDMAECHVLLPELFALVSPLRALLAARAAAPAAEITLARVDQGVDIGLRGIPAEGLAATEALLGFARAHAPARLTLDRGFGPEPLWEPEPVTVTLGGVATPFPPGSFLQATRDGEAALVGAARAWLAGAATVADLFAGLGTFAFALADPATGPAKVLAVEAARDAHLAVEAAAGRGRRQVRALHRDLFRDPLRADELDRFAGVLLDPPRAGARAQVAQLAASRVPRVVYLSCNPASWARDAAALVAAGYTLAELRPVGQFRWSTHVELASLFVRAGDA